MTELKQSIANNSKIHLVNHPLIVHKLTVLRDKNTGTNQFRTILKEISMLLAYEVTKDLDTEEKEIETPVAKTKSPVIRGKKICLVSILRAGNGLLDGMLDVIPSARVGHIGLFRDPKTLEPKEYYCKMPENMQKRQAIVVDPMLATANSAIAAIHKVKTFSPTSVKFVCLLAAPEGIHNLTSAHPDVEIFTPAIDDYLNEKGYIVPGLGDAGDRIYGTK